MGLADELSYTIARPNAFHRGMQAIGSSRPGAWFFAHTLARADRLLDRISRGRLTVPAALARLPVLVLTSTGRRSGQPRQTHLIAVPFADSLALLGTNFGQPGTPNWVLNLEAEPRATVTHHGVRRDVVAQPATDAERAEILRASARVYGGYLKYQQRITGRRLRIFVLAEVVPGVEIGEQTGP
jgi:deazaflavin-dependent oxidoreductase (nitroreductase family)